MKLGIIGSWGHFGSVLDETKSMPEVEIIGLTKGVPEEDSAVVRKRYPSTAGAPEFSSTETLLAEGLPDAVIISTRLDHITELAITAAEAGCHIICEKPLALNHSALNRLWEVVTKNGVQCYAILNNRIHPVLAAARRAVLQGMIGTVRLLNARKSYCFGNSRPAWFGERASYGGTIPWVGIHALDFISAVIAERATSVAAFHANTSHHDWPDCEDNAVIILQFQDVSMASISIDYLRPAAAATHGDDWLRIVGEQGVIEAQMGRGRCLLTTCDKPEHELKLHPARPYFAPLLRGLQLSGRQIPDAATRRAFISTDVALHARTAADKATHCTIPDAPWSFK